MGASIEGAGTDVVRIQGVEALQPVDHAIIPDRIEAGTFLVAAAATAGDVLVRNCQLEHLEAVAAKLRQAGVEVVRQDDGVRVLPRRGPLRALEITTAPHPGFPTDMQAQLMTLLTAATGRSVVTETIFENRFMHVGELRRMGADIEIRGRTAFVTGPTPLSGAQVMATDLRASASLVIAGLMAEGTTEILRVYHIDRGYEHIEKKLQGLGAKIERFRARG
jgi:UDP-N-acetylglucosamine 1-carboxyvinyltransferase